MNHPGDINKSAKSSPANSNAFAGLSLKASPFSTRTASFAAAPAPQNSSASKKGVDSFSNLVSFGRDKQNSGLSLLEQQKRLEEQRRKDEEEKRLKMDALFGGGGGTNNRFWNALDGTGGTKGILPAAAPLTGDDDDILAAFSSAAPVDASSHFPPPLCPITPLWNGASLSSNIDLVDIAPSALAPVSDPFDPFDTQNLPSHFQSPFTAQLTPQTQDDDLDILGDLARPVSGLPPHLQPQPSHSPRPEPRLLSPSQSSGPSDVIADIMDMGFTVEQALAATDTGDGVQGPVGWPLEQAHQESGPAPASERPRGSESRHEPTRIMHDREIADASPPAWARGGKGGGEKDIGAYAAEVGGTLFKSANSLWSTGRKKVEKAVAELKADLADGGGDSAQPKWMRERQIREGSEKRGARGTSWNDRPLPERIDDGEPRAPITDEALMLEMGSGLPQPRKKHREERPMPPSRFSKDVGMPERVQVQRQRMQDIEAAIREKELEMRDRERGRAAAATPDSASRKAKLAAENEPAYCSSNHRRPPATSSVAPPKPPTPESGIPGSSGGSKGSGSSLNPSVRDLAAERQRTPQMPTPTATLPPYRQSPPQQRPTVPVSSSVVFQSNAAHQQGTEAFKRGDYTAAQALYTMALKPIPNLHPLRIIVLTNRSLCTMKLGDPKSALVDVEAILSLIGESRGEAETMSLDGVEKHMKKYWSKAVLRKAECLEQLEKWADAKAAWELSLTAGSNAAAINGKRRCEASLNHKAPPKQGPKAPVAAPRRPPVVYTRPSRAVTALRQANAAHEKQEAERLELHDAVHERIENWKSGREGNLRALLAGLDTVLWEGSGWRKVGMGELLVPQKCKVAYMKGIGKVHPDKIRQDATTEQKMISGAVFSLLNDAWAKFKVENGL